MTREEAQAAQAAMEIAYPNYHPENPTDTVNLWYELLNQYPDGVVLSAVKAYIITDTKGFAPTIGQIIDKIKTTTEPLELSEGEAWNLVAGAVKNGIYGAEKEYNRLPPTVQKAVGTPEQITAWAMMPSDEVHSVVSSNFMRTYRAVVAREKEQAKLPSNLRQLTAVTAIEDKTAEPEINTGVPMPEWARERLEGMFA